MKIILSPSKGKHRVIETREGSPILFPTLTRTILDQIRGFSKEDLGSLLKIQGNVLEKTYTFYQSYSEEMMAPAYEVYDGVAFKSFDAPSLKKLDFDYAQEHLVILSALYGCVQPLTMIKAYRLDMNNSLGRDFNLYKIWQDSINQYFEGENCIYNLASKEYAKILKGKQMINFEFLDFSKGQWRVISHNVKHMRGLMARYIIENRIETFTDLLDISLGGYVYDSYESSENFLVYKRLNK